MKKVIRADRLDDIRRDREAYKQKKKAYDEAKEQDWQNYSNAEDAALNPIKEYVESRLQPYTSVLSITVEVERAFGHSIRLTVNCNQNNHFDEKSALSWNYDVTLKKDGTIEKETGSWSGLQATTADQMNSLQATVMALQTLNAIDWADVMNVQLPSMSDYDTAGEEPQKEYDYDTEEAKEEIHAIVGTHKGIEVQNRESFGFRISPRDGVIAFIVSETPGMYRIITINKNALSRPEVRTRVINEIDQGTYESQIRKANLVPTKPLNVIDLDTYSDEE